MKTDLEQCLKEFKKTNHITSKGRLSVVVQLTDSFASRPLPLDPKEFTTGQHGQVSGLSGGNLKRVLAQYQINKILSSEGGRTSRGSIGLLEAYADFINNVFEEQGEVDFNKIQNFWIQEVRDFFKGKPFVLQADESRTVRASLNDLFDQAKKRQQQGAGTQYLGIVLQHLVAAKLLMILGEDGVEVFGASTSDDQLFRDGDFLIDDSVIHCTTMPGSALIDKCNRNLQGNLRPVIITVFERVQTALDLIEDAGLTGRVDVWDIQQFLSANVQEHSLFVGKNRNKILKQIVENYNLVIDRCEGDPSLKIMF